MDGCTEAQYRPVMEGLNRPASGGRDWELLIGGEQEGGVAHNSMGAGDWSKKNNTEKNKVKTNGCQEDQEETGDTGNTRWKTTRLKCLGAGCKCHTVR